MFAADNAIRARVQPYINELPRDVPLVFTYTNEQLAWFGDNRVYGRRCLLCCLCLCLFFFRCCLLGSKCPLIAISLLSYCVRFLVFVCLRLCVDDFSCVYLFGLCLPLCSRASRGTEATEQLRIVMERYVYEV